MAKARISIHRENISFTNNLISRISTKKIILHHSAGTGTVKAVHKAHIMNGWSGIGYHFYIDKKGNIWQGRPLDKVGAHCTGHNSYSVGICFEGNFQKSAPTSAQIENGKKLVGWLLKKYKLKSSDIYGHKDLLATACPGVNFPLCEFKKINPKSATVKYYSSESAVKYKAKVTAKNGLNVRKDASLSSKIIGSKKYNDIIEIIKESKSDGYTWGKLKDSGWVCLLYTKEV